jgi:hypothetical protein
MDELIKQGQWWWLVSVPVLAGAFALLGSWLGSKLGKSTEHWQWLRNEKRKEYIAAIASMDTLTHGMGKLARLEAREPSASAKPTFIPPINVLAPNSVKLKLNAFLAASNAYMEIHTLDSEDRQPMLQAHREVEKANSEFLLAVRNDLGVKD